MAVQTFSYINESQTLDDGGISVHQHSPGLKPPPVQDLLHTYN